MRIQVFIDGVDRGEVELTGPALMPWANVAAWFGQALSDGDTAANPPTDDDPGDFLDIATQASLKARRRPRTARKAARRA